MGYARHQWWPLKLSKTTYGGVQINEDGARDVFPVASLGEEGLEGTSLVAVLLLWVYTSIGQEAVLEQVPVTLASVRDAGRER